jgi:hypothetical protein
MQAFWVGFVEIVLARCEFMVDVKVIRTRCAKVRTCRRLYCFGSGAKKYFNVSFFKEEYHV